MEGTTSACSVSCQHALVGLISTAEGERLMDCTCQNPDCSLEKKRVEPCREEVIGVFFCVEIWGVFGNHGQFIKEQS